MNSFETNHIDNQSMFFKTRVLVVGASGGLGQIAVQILKGWRCYVTAVCSASAIEQLSMNRLPADRLFAYDTEQLELNQLRNEFDAILDYRPADSQPTLVYAQSLKANFSSFYVTASSPVLRHLDRDGWILGSACIALDLAGLHVKAAQSGRHVRWAFYHPNRCGLNELARLVDEDIVQAPLDRMFDFDQVPQAYEAMASGHSRGRIVIRHKS